MDRRNDFADILRGISAYLVILGHCLLSTGTAFGVSENGNGLLAVHIIYSFHMPLFMLLCGYFSEKSYKKHGGKTFVRNRIISLIPPLITWSVIQLIWGLMEKEIIVGDIPRVFLLKFFSNYWFVWAVLILSIGSVAIEKIYGEKALVAYVCIILLGFVTPDAVVNSSGVKFMLPYYVIGFKISQYAKSCILSITQKLRKGNIHYIGIVIVLNLISVLICLYYPTEWLIHISEISCINKDAISQLTIDLGRYAAGLVNSMVFAVDVWLLYARCVKKATKKWLIVLKPWIWSGKNSMGLYIVHYYILNYLAVRVIVGIGNFSIVTIILESIAVWGISAFVIQIVNRMHGGRILFGK